MRPRRSEYLMGLGFKHTSTVSPYMKLERGSDVFWVCEGCMRVRYEGERENLKTIEPHRLWWELSKYISE